MLYFLLLAFLHHASAVSLGNSNPTDELALVSFKSMMSSGPSSLLASWNISSHFCRWPGVVCGHRHPDRVVALHLGSFGLSGRISPFLGNLSFLKELDLHENQLVGEIPMELGQLSRLQLLNMSKNHLNGRIPEALGRCTKLRRLDLSDNQLQGEIQFISDRHFGKKINPISRLMMMMMVCRMDPSTSRRLEVGRVLVFAE